MSISPDARISRLDSFVGSSSLLDGTSGQVPTPMQGDEDKFLRGDGTWAASTSTGGGGGSTVYNAQATVDFGFPSGQEGDIATVTVSATWVLATSIITVSPYAFLTADHDPEDYAAEGITAYAANFATGVSFDIIARAPNNSWGRYVINAMGV
jgi:hypothetical protein